MTVDPFPTTLVLFGASSLCGEVLIGQIPAGSSWLALGRQRPAWAEALPWQACDLTDLSMTGLARSAAVLPEGPQVWIAFAHLWLLAPFLRELLATCPGRLEGLRGVVACGSSSVITKRFATNRFDRELVLRLGKAGDQLMACCLSAGIPACILAPTMIHGRTLHQQDRNVETLRRLLRRLPLLPLPAHTGLRQPIAAADLAAVALDQARRIASGDAPASGLIPLGGDELISYRQLLERIQQGDPRAARCRLLSLPTRLFQALAAPLVLLSPRSFETVQRLSADLAGFSSAAEWLDRPPRPFAPAPPFPQ